MSNSREQKEQREFFEYSLKENILSYIFSQVYGISEIESFEENAGSFYVTLINGDSYYLQVGKCNNEEA